MIRPAFVSQSPSPWIGGVSCHHKLIAASAPAAIRASTAAGRARAGADRRTRGRVRLGLVPRRESGHAGSPASGARGPRAGLTHSSVNVTPYMSHGKFCFRSAEPMSQL